jgi:hypothetical protein
LGAGVALGAGLAAGVVSTTVAVGIGVYRIEGGGVETAAVEQPTRRPTRTAKLTARRMENKSVGMPLSGKGSEPDVIAPNAGV